jgi:alkanesulfonate monooxygenase
LTPKDIMVIELPGKVVNVLTISPRTLDQALYWHNIKNVIQWSDKYNCTGVLIFTGNDTFVDPWLVAHTVLIDSTNLSPLIAVNPIYMHPFTVAKMISSFAYMYGRKVFLNMVTGTALSYLDSLDDKLSHDERYERLKEYIVIIKSLVASEGLTTLHGNFYRVSNLQLLPKVPKSLFPEFLIAGQSEAARKVCQALKGIGMQMLPPDIDSISGDIEGIHFGIVTRDSEAQAWEAAHRLFPEDKEGQEILAHSMINTDSVWKKRMKAAISMENPSNRAYWLEPFRNFNADCPYFIGDYNQVTDLLVRLICKGVRVLILDIPAYEEEFYHIDLAFKKASERLRAGNQVGQ